MEAVWHIKGTFRHPFLPVELFFHFSTDTDQSFFDRLSTKAIEQKSQLQPCRSCSSQLSPRRERGTKGQSPSRSGENPRPEHDTPVLRLPSLPFPRVHYALLPWDLASAPLAEKVGELQGAQLTSLHVHPTSQACDLFPLPFSIPYFHHFTQYQDWLARLLY